MYKLVFILDDTVLPLSTVNQKNRKRDVNMNSTIVLLKLNGREIYVVDDTDYFTRENLSREEEREIEDFLFERAYSA